MKHTLLNKYIAGETTTDEEHKLMLLLQESPELTSEESAVLQLLQYGNSDSAEEDIFAVDYSEEYNKVVRPRKIIRIWPLVAAACVAAILIVFLTPPKDDVSPIMSQTEIAKAEPQPAATQEKEDLPGVMPTEAARTTEKSIIANTPTKARLNATPQAEDYKIPEESSTSRGIELPAVTITPKSMASTTTSESMDEIFATTMPDLANTQISTNEFNATIRDKGMALSGKIQTLISE